MTLVSRPNLPRLGPDGSSWWQSPFRVFQTNLREPDADQDVERTLDAIEEHGANVWLVNGGGILSFYPTDLEFQTRTPFLDGRPSGDLLGDAVDAAHRRGIRVVARMDFSKVTARVAEQHPEWLYVDPAGEYQQYQGLYSTCPSAGYYQDAAFDALSEVASRYSVDGFFFNWFGFNEVDYSGRYRGVSQNPESRRRFAEWSGGKELPIGPESETYVPWKQFASEVISDLTHRFRTHISQLLPGAAFIRGLSSDVIFHEANNEIGRAVWPSATGEAVSSIKTARPEQPVFVNSVAFVDMPYRLAAEESGRYEQYIAQTIARGGNPSVYIMGVPGAIDYPNVDAVAPLFRFHRDNVEQYTDLEPAAAVAVVRPDPLRMRPDDYALARDEFRGVYRSLQQRHIPFDVLPLADLSTEPGALGRHSVVVVPDCGELDSAAVRALDASAEAGATVILTGSSGVTGASLAGTPVQSYGEQISGRELYATYAVATADDAGHPRHPVVPVYGAFSPIRLREDAAPLLRVVPPAPYGPPEKAHGNITSAEAASGRRSFGRGSVVVIPWTAGRTFHDLGLTVVRDMIADTVEEALGPEVALRFELPPHVEVTVMARGETVLVHLVNLSGVQGNGFTTPLPVADARIVSPHAVAATDLLNHESLTVQPDPETGSFIIRLRALGSFAAIRLDPVRPSTAEGDRTS